MLQLHQGMEHALACVLSTVGNSYHSSVTLELIAPRNQNLAAGMLQGVSNVLQHGWQLLLQHSLCLGAITLWGKCMQLKKSGESTTATGMQHAFDLRLDTIEAAQHSALLLRQCHDGLIF